MTLTISRTLRMTTFTWL